MDADAASTRASIQLQLEDARQLSRKRKHGQEEDDTRDFDMALDSYVGELKRCDTILTDREMANSMALAAPRAGKRKRISHQDQQSASDQDATVRLPVQDGPIRESAGSRPVTEERSFIRYDRAASTTSTTARPFFSFPGFGSGDDTVARPSASATFEADTAAETTTLATTEIQACEGKSNDRSCIICRDKKDSTDYTTVPCKSKHDYCRDCLAYLFKQSLTDTSLFPPRCDGQEITLQLARPLIPSDIADEFESRYEELSDKKPLHCCDISCATFIPPAIRGHDVAACPKCSKTTCTTCKNASHAGDCPEDIDLQKLMQIAKDEQWQRCYDCTRFVELNIGCNHMTCLCGAQFCYKCGQKWKDCSCAQWDEDRLMARAEQVVHRNGAQHRIADMAERLRLHYNCATHGWRYIAGRHDCEVCLDTLYRYIWDCDACHMLACTRCTRNRL